MLRRSVVRHKKAFTIHPRSGSSGFKNPAWNPKLQPAQRSQFNWAFNLEFPRRHPKVWNDHESRRLGMQQWPKQVGFYNAGDNFELSPEMHYRLFARFHNNEHWSADHSEKTIIAQFPLIEADPKGVAMQRVDEVFQKHVTRFGADHIIYNAVMQARAFAKDYDGALALFKEMGNLGLEPNAQSYFNLIVAVRMAGKPRTVAEEHFQRAVSSGALSAVVRLDTEFDMWWSQLERMGSFESGDGHLSVKEEGAAPLPRDPYAIWGWDRSERKFVLQKMAVRAEVRRRERSGGMTGTVYSGVQREPWFKYRGMARHDYKGPPQTPPRGYRDANATAPRVGPNAYTGRRR